MRLMTWNIKGGVGKTTLAVSIALSKGFGIVTNDIYSPIGKILPTKHTRVLEIDEALPEFENKVNIIYDFGGYIDRRAVQVLKIVDTVIVPTINEDLALQATINSVAEILEYNKNILIVVNRCKKDDFQKASELINAHCGNIPMLPLKESKIFQRMIRDNQEVESIMNTNGLTRHVFKTVNEQFQNIISTLNIK